MTAPEPATENDLAAVERLAEGYRRMTEELGKVIVGQHAVIEELMIALLSGGHCLLVGVPGDPDPDLLLRDFKSYGSRALNHRWPKPASGTWWAESGSKRKKADDAAVRSAIEYVRDQPNPLTVWLADEAQDFIRRAGGVSPPSGSHKG